MGLLQQDGHFLLEMRLLRVTGSEKTCLVKQGKGWLNWKTNKVYSPYWLGPGPVWRKALEGGGQVRLGLMSWLLPVTLHQTKTNFLKRLEVARVSEGKWGPEPMGGLNC
jgi:hypothetical protein